MYARTHTRQCISQAVKPKTETELKRKFRLRTDCNLKVELKNISKLKSHCD